MTIASTINRVTYAGNGTTTNFSVPYLFLANTDLRVYQNGVLKTLTTHYTVSGAGNPAGGTVTFLAAPASGDGIVILNDPPITQTLDLEDNDALPAEPVERAFDRLTIIAQRLSDRLNRAAVLPDSYVGAANPALPTPEASTFLGWTSDASGLRNYTRTEIATIAAFGDAVVDKFTGDGSTTAFTLSKDPGSQDNLLVSVGGAVQENGVDFTWSPSAPTTLTFASAPPNGEKIQVYYQQALPAGSTTADQVTFAPAGTGAVARTVQAKLRETVSVKDFGAVGDGVTDDTAAIQAALNSGARGIFIPKGTYIISGAGLSCPDYITLIGEGKGSSILKLAPGLSNIYPILHERNVGGVLQPIKGIHVEKLTFWGNGSASEPVPATSALFRCYSSQENTFVDCEFKFGRGYGVGLQGAPVAADVDKRGPHVGDRFVRCDFYSNGLLEYITGTDTMDGMDVKSSDRLYVESCRFVQNGDKGLDIRGTNVQVVNCLSDGNTIGFSLGAVNGYAANGTISNCVAMGATISGYQFYGTPTSPTESEYSIVNCVAEGGARGLLVPSGVPGVIDGNLSLQIHACSFRRNNSDGMQINSPVNLLTCYGSYFVENTGKGVVVANDQPAQKPVLFNACVFSANRAGGYVGSNDAAAEQTFIGCLFDANFVVGLQANDNVVSVGSVFIRNQGSNHVSVTGNNSRFVTPNLNPVAVASASTITLPVERNSFVVTGTTNITSITASWNGREVTLRFTGALTVVDGGNLFLAGDLVTANRTVLRLMCDGTNWYELSRSVNN